MLVSSCRGRPGRAGASAARQRRPESYPAAAPAGGGARGGHHLHAAAIEV